MQMSLLMRRLTELQALISTSQKFNNGALRISEADAELIEKKLAECVEATVQVGLGIAAIQQVLNRL